MDLRYIDQVLITNQHFVKLFDKSTNTELWFDMVEGERYELVLNIINDYKYAILEKGNETSIGELARIKLKYQDEIINRIDELDTDIFIDAD